MNDQRYRQPDIKCKACNIISKVKDDDIKHMLKRIIESNNFIIVDQETYSGRLKKCSCCKSLILENTCAECGCIVQVRAAIATNKCPKAYESEW